MKSHHYDSAAMFLRAKRKQLGISQENVAHNAGLAVSTYVRFERKAENGNTKNPTMKTLNALIRALNLTEEESIRLISLLASR